MAVQTGSSGLIATSIVPALNSRRRSPPQFDFRCNGSRLSTTNLSRIWTSSVGVSALGRSNASKKSSQSLAAAASSSSSSSSSPPSSSAPNSNYVVPLDKSVNSSCITRPIIEILRDLNKRVPDNIVKPEDDDHSTNTIPWYHANRMLSFYAPGWCGEIRDVIFSDNGSVTVVYRVTIRGSDAEAHRESTGTVSSSNPDIVDPVAAAEQIAFCKACARFGLGLYLFHEE